MAKLGMKRREVVKDNLAGQAEIKPVYLRGSGISQPSMPRIPPSPAAGMVDALGSFASKQLQDIANAQNMRAQLDGATMAAQGETFEQVETSGNKWAAEGFALMNGMIVSSSMVAAQVEQIENGGFAMPMDQFRANYVARMDDAIRGQNPQIATAIRDEFTKQMPALIAKHTTMHMEHLEKQNYDSLVQSLDVLSQDPTGEDRLKNFATISDQSASAYLSDERKQSAIARGVQVAFRNNNPLAYGFLRKNGLLEQLTLEQRRAVEASKAAFQGRMRTEANEVLVTGLQDLENRFNSGEILGPEMTMRTAELLAEHNITITQQEQVDIYRRAADLDNTRLKTKHIALEAALLAKDYDVAGSITGDVIEYIESKGDLYAVGPLILKGANKGTRAQGSMQVVWNTLRKPGFGILPIQNNSAQEKRRVGREYWAVMFKGRQGNSMLNWDAGDAEAAAIAYNAGPDNAIKWIKNNRNYNKLPQTKASLIYWANYQKRLTGMKSPRVGDKYNTAVAMLADAKADAIVASTDAWNQNMAPVTELFAKSDGGPVSIAAFRKGADLAREAAGLAMSQATVATENAHQARILSAISVDKSEKDAAAAKLQFTLDMFEPNAAFADVTTNEKSTPAERTAARKNLLDATAAAMEGQGFVEVATALTEVTDRMTSRREANAPIIRQRELDKAEISKAIEIQSFDSLSKKNANEALEIVAQNLDKALQETFNKQGKSDRLTKDVTTAVANSEFAKLWNKFQRVDPDVRAQANTAIMQGLVDDKGNAREAAVAAIIQYKAVRDHDPNGRVRELFLHEDARALAEAVIFNSGPGGDIAEAAGYVGRNLNPDAAIEADAIATTTKMEDAIKKAVDNRLDEDIVSIFQAIVSPRADLADVGRYTPSEMTSLQSVDQQALQIDAVTNEVRRLAFRHPNNRPAWLLDMAMQNVKQRSANIGANWIQLNYNIKAMMLGDKVGNVDKDGLVNQIIVEWLASPAMQAEHPGMGDVGWTELFMGGVQDALTHIPVFGIDWTRGLAERDAEASLARGVRPFRSYVDASGNNLFIEWLDQDGNSSPPVRIDLIAAGRLYLKTHYGSGPLRVHIPMPVD